MIKIKNKLETKNYKLETKNYQMLRVLVLVVLTLLFTKRIVDRLSYRLDIFLAIT